MEIMSNLIVNVIVTISLWSIVIYDGVVILRLIGKENIIEKVYKNIFPNKKYDKEIFFAWIRPIFLDISFLTALLVCNTIIYGVVGRIWKLLFYTAPIWAIINYVLTDKDKDNT